MKRSFKNIYWYASKEFIFSFIVAFLFFFVIFFINNILVIAEQILARHIPFPKVLELIFYSLPFVIAMSVPFGTLVGALMSVGRFSSDNEVLAIQCCGVAQYRLFIPLLFWGFILFILSFFIYDYLIPAGTANFNRLYRDILFTNPELELEPNTVKEYQDRIIIPGEVIDRVIYNMVIIDLTNDNRQRVITAEKAHLLKNAAQDGIISLELEKVITQIPSISRQNEFEYETAEFMIYNILLSEITSSIRNPGPQEMSTRQVWDRILEKRADLQVEIDSHFEVVNRNTYELYSQYRALAHSQEETEQRIETRLGSLMQSFDTIQQSRKQVFFDRSLQIYEIEFWQKLSIPVGCIVFVIMAFPLGLFSKRSGRAVGFGMGLFVAGFYWAVLLGAKTMGVRSSLPPVLIMMFPNILILVMGILFNWIKRRK